MADSYETIGVQHSCSDDSLSFQIQAWDSEFFGFKIADYAPDTHDLLKLEHVKHEAASQHVSLLVYRAPKGVQPVPSSFMSLVDRRHTYTFDLEGADLTTLARGNGQIEIYRDQESNDLLETIAVKAGIHSRFFKDPYFPKPAAIALYKAWMRASVKKEIADVVFITRDDSGEIAGIGTGRIDDDGLGIPSLMAIQDHMIGKGLGRSFVLACMQWLQNQAVTQAEITTQGANTLACNTYKRMGWKFKSNQDIFHIWLAPPTIKSSYL